MAEFIGSDKDIPAGILNAILQKNAKNIKAYKLLELGNSPISPEADKILHRKNKIVIPDILGIARGVTLRYFEWVKNKTNYYWNLEKIHKKLREKISNDYNTISVPSQSKKFFLWQVCYIHGIGRIQNSIHSMEAKEYFIM